MVIRSEHNPILTAADVPYPAATVHNAGACRLGDRYILLFRFHRRNGRSAIGVAESENGLRFTVRPNPFWSRPGRESLRSMRSGVSKTCGSPPVRGRIS